MKFVKWALVAALVAIVGVAVFHLGPSLYTSRSVQRLCSLRLKDGSLLALVLQANGNLIEAYTVTLYRFYPAGTVQAAKWESKNPIGGCRT
jgi:hypothetical protein